MTDTSPHPEDFAPGRPIVFRNGIVITVDTPGVILDGDVLITGDTITAVGQGLPVPEGTVEIDASGGILMPGMIDTHRHMWQTALRGYGGDWALSQYFVFYYLQHGQVFRPEDIYAGNLLSALESVDTGVTTTLDWSHALRTPDYAEAALQAFDEIPGRFVLGYGNYLGGAVGVDEHRRVRSLRRATLLEPDRHARPADRLRRDRRRGLPREGGLREGSRTWGCASRPTPGCGARRPTSASTRCTTPVS